MLCPVILANFLGFIFASGSVFAGIGSSTPLTLNNNKRLVTHKTDGLDFRSGVGVFGLNCYSLMSDDGKACLFFCLGFFCICGS